MLNLSVDFDALCALMTHWLTAERELTQMPHYERSWFEVKRTAKILGKNLGLDSDDIDDIIRGVMESSS